jgi:hypothetical protein
MLPWLSVHLIKNVTVFFPRIYSGYSSEQRVTSDSTSPGSCDLLRRKERTYSSDCSIIFSCWNLRSHCTIPNLGTWYGLFLKANFLSLVTGEVSRLQDPKAFSCNYKKGNSKLNSSPQKWPAAKVKQVGVEILSEVTVKNIVFCHG